MSTIKNLSNIEHDKIKNKAHKKIVVIGTLFFSFEDFEKAGLLSRMINLYDKYSQSFDKVFILTYDSKRFEGLPDNVQHLPFPRVPLKKFFYFFFSGFLNYRRVDYIEAYGASAILPALIFKIGGARLFLYYRWNLSGILRDQNKFILSFLAKLAEIIAFKTADVIAVTTKSLWQKVSRYARRDKIHLLPNYVDVDHFKRIKMTKKQNLLIFIGRLHPDKNLPLLLEAMGQLPDYELWIIGEGILREQLLQQKKEKEIDNVKFLGLVQNKELPKYLNKAEAFILISHREGHPKALIEAMACGLPCIGTNVDGIRDVIIDGDNGFLCDKNVESIRNCVLTMFGDREKMKQLGENARGFAVQNYSMEEVVKRRIRLIKGEAL